MRTAILKNLLTGKTIQVKATTDHSASSYGQPVWVDDQGESYGTVGMPLLGYEIEKQEQNSDP